jgi:cyclic beta-1,2-glucan synthetase
VTVGVALDGAETATAQLAEPRIAHRCPGLHDEATWDEPELLRGEILTAERLSEHAVEVARAHGRGSRRVTQGPLRRRFAEARARIAEAYEVLSRGRNRTKGSSPAEEWLLDNAHIVEDQLREIKEDLPPGYLVELPRLSHGKMRGYPRVYGLCIDYLRHTDARVDLPTLTAYVVAYQSVHTLTIGELWAIPIMLRMGLVLAVGARAASEASARDRDRGQAWAAALIEVGHTRGAVSAALAALEKRDPPVTGQLVVELLRNLREHEAPLGAAADWVGSKCEAMRTTPEQLTRQHHLQLAADQVSVANAITSMRAIGALEWNDFFEQTSAVESVLRRDPASAYRAMDIATRDRYRHAVERIARRSRRDERHVAEAAITLADDVRTNDADEARAHVGFWLIGDGLPDLERVVRYRPTVVRRLVGHVLASPTPFYLGAILLLTIAAVAAAASVGSALLDPWPLAVLVLLFSLPAGEMAIAIVNSVAVVVIPPRLLPRMAYDRGIPAEQQTLVVVPALLDRPETVRQLLEGLEIRSLANPDAGLRFALLTDYCDHDAEVDDDDEQLLALAQKGIAELNARWRGTGEHRYVLFHRCRVQDASQRVWMGWERKRGKLTELNRWLRGRSDTTFSLVTAPRELLSTVRYVITLDADTDLPRDVARELVATLAHPLNRPHVDPALRRVVSGHGVIQPRVGTHPVSARQSRYSRIASGPIGLDPYTTAVSDVYQDLFDEGSFVGKGIYDVDAFMAALEGRVPDDYMLSHDLFEGLFARSALASDIEVLDAQPTSYEVAACRLHRWTRGDWQMLPWLLDPALRRGLRAIDIWKLTDNLRRSLLAPAMVASCLMGWFLSPAAAAWVTGTLAAMFLVPVLARVVLNIARARSPQSFSSVLGGDLRGNVAQSMVNTIFLLDNALVSLDAIARTLHRLWVTRRDLLEWTTMGQSEQSDANRMHPRIVAGSALAVGAFVAVVVRSPFSLPFAAPVLALWAAAPAVAAWLRRAPSQSKPPLTKSERRELRLIAARTWRFFETFVTDEDHDLPPDNYQEDPRSVLARRTSPTNIGLYLLSVVAAHDLGFIELDEVVDRLTKTLDSVDKLEHREGHLLNWFDTATLEPLEPKYVSTVDSGNLAAHLWTLRQACGDLLNAPFVRPETLEAAVDALGIAETASPPANIERMRASLATARELLAAGAATARSAIAAACAQAEAVRASIADRDSSAESVYWVERAIRHFEATRASVAVQGSLAAPLEAVPTGLRAKLGDKWDEFVRLTSLVTSPASLLAHADDITAACIALEAEGAEVARVVAEVRLSVERSREVCRALERSLATIGMRAGAMADAMSFGFLYDETRKLFSIGYSVSAARLDGSHYDLLASESRLASLVAISKGDVPLEHWFRMGRQRAAVSPSERALLSWSGSMFEYLMPLLVTKSYDHTLLDETCASVIDAQVAYGAKKGVPWGVSESAFNLMDLAMTYQYRAFGVPGLGLKAGLGDDLVIAPYATALAAQVRPQVALENFRALEKAHLLGAYGFHDSVDFTPGRLPPGRTSVVVKTFMAHHQGMTLVALDNVIHHGRMQSRFHRDPRIKASELLLEERIPERAPLLELRASSLPTPAANEADLDVIEHVGLGVHPIGRLHLLGHGELSTAVTVLGEGFTTWKGMDVYRFREDAALEAGGVYVYIRNQAADKTWSVGLLPTRTKPDFYDVSYAIDRVEIHRRDDAIETTTEITVSPERPAEVRRITLTNHGESPCDIEVTSYTEAVLAPRGADVAHRAFSGMFIETEALPEQGALLARRRPRSPSEPETWLVQVLWPEPSAGDSRFEYTTSRGEFVGRGQATADPVGMHGPLSATTGAVLDPALVLRRSLHIAGGGRARLTLTTALAESRADALELVSRYSMSNSIQRAFELSWADARVELKHIGITATQSHWFQRLLSALIFPQAALRISPDRSVIHGRGRSGLWVHGLTSDLPITLVRIDSPDFSDLLREVLLAQEFWRLNGVTADVVILNEEPAGYMQPQQEALLSLVRSSPGATRVDQRGGVFLRRACDMTDEEVALLCADSRVTLTASRGSLMRQLGRLDTPALAMPPSLPAPSKQPRRPSPPTRERDVLGFDNGLGGFTGDSHAYAMTLSDASRPPMPWCNVIANPRFGTMVSESGASCTWYANSQRHRLTPWSNDPVCDPSGEMFWLRDELDRSVWSPTPAPAGSGAEYVVRHGAGYSSFEHQRGELIHTLVVAVSPHDAVKTWHLTLRNVGSTPRRLSLFGFVEWVLGSTRERSRVSIITEWDEAGSTMLATNPLSLHPERCALFTATATVGSHTGDREEFFGSSGSRARPAALGRTVLSGRVGFGFDACAALQVPIVVAPGSTFSCAFVLGEAATTTEARALARRYRDPVVSRDVLTESTDLWRDVCGAIVVHSPDPALDILVNQWLLYQVLSCRVWGRTAFYQSGGAYGFRDQIQDVLALLHARPDVSREQILRAAGRQFVEGDVQHWWHDGTGEGVRTRCSDDMLWLPYAVAHYVRTTGDVAILDEQVSFLTERALTPTDEDIFNTPGTAPDTATLYEHCTRALDVGATSGPHGLPKMGSGDWNDGMNRVGRGGQGESVWLAWFLARTALDFSRVAESRRDGDRVAWCTSLAARLATAVDEHAWDGAWYRRAYFDDGTPLGAEGNVECAIDAIAQSWSVIAGIGDPARAKQALRSAEDRLVRVDSALMRLLWPPFDKAEPDPGYIRAYPNGIRENGGQYTHGALWTVHALTLLGEGDRALALMSLLNPIHHSSTRERMERYRVEPYVVASDVYDGPEHVGRGGWTWYTGAAAWMYRIAVEQILGVRRAGSRLTIAPCIARGWPGFELTYRDGAGELHIVIENPDGVEHGVRRVEIGGSVSADGVIPLTGEAGRREVRVVMGA